MTKKIAKNKMQNTMDRQPKKYIKKQEYALYHDILFPIHPFSLVFYQFFDSFSEKLNNFDLDDNTTTFLDILKNKKSNWEKSIALNSTDTNKTLGSFGELFDQLLDSLTNYNVAKSFRLLELIKACNQNSIEKDKQQFINEAFDLKERFILSLNKLEKNKAGRKNKEKLKNIHSIIVQNNDFNKEYLESLDIKTIIQTDPYYGGINFHIFENQSLNLLIKTMIFELINYMQKEHVDYAAELEDILSLITSNLLIKQIISNEVEITEILSAPKSNFKYSKTPVKNKSLFFSLYFDKKLPDVSGLIEKEELSIKIITWLILNSTGNQFIYLKVLQNRKIDFSDDMDLYHYLLMVILTENGKNLRDAGFALFGESLNYFKNSSSSFYKEKAINSLQNRKFLENLTANQGVIVFEKIIEATDDIEIIDHYLEILFKNEKYTHIIKYIENKPDDKKTKRFYKRYIFSLISLGEYQKAMNIMGEIKTFDDDFIPYLSMIIRNITLLDFYHLLEYFVFSSIDNNFTCEANISCESIFLELLSELDKGNFDEEKITDIQLITTIHNTIVININAFDPYNIKDDLKELQKTDPEQLKYLLMKELFHSLVIDIPTHVVSQNNSEKDKMHVAEPQNDYISTMDKMNKTMKLKQDISTEEDIKRARHHESSLHIIRLAIENTIIFHQGEKILKKEKEKRKAEEQAREKLQQMIQQFSHTMANTLFPNSIFEVVNRLKKHVEFNKDARVLFDAYQAELLMSNQGQLLRAKNGGSGAEFQSFIRQDRRDQDTLGTTGTESIVQRSAERLIGRFLNSSYHKIDTVRNEICVLSNKNLDELRQNYEQNVFFEERENIIDWINKYIGLFEVTIDDTWQSIQMLENGYSDAMLQGHLGEILFNALKYSDWTKNKWCRLSFISDENYLFIQCSNSQRKNPETSHSGKGLLGIANDLNMLSNNHKTLEKTIEKDKFTVNLIYQKDLFIKRKLKLEAWGD